MKISYIRIENFRGVQSLELKFGDRMNVFVGENGAGKSTVLSALKYLMSWFTARMQSREGSGIFIKEEDITNAMPFCRLQIRLDDGTYWKLFRQRKNVREKAWDKTDLTELTALTDRLVAEHDDKNETIPYPMIAHYGVNRAVTEAKPELEKKSKMKPLDAYDGKLNNGANFNKFFNWFREREDIENANFRDSGCLKEDMQLKAVRKALESAISGFSKFHVSRNPRSFVLEKDGTELSLDQLSDGEKCYLTLVGDIARLLSMTNPETQDPLMGYGCVMIDEVDLHLHPQWQSEVINRLAVIFPNCQFFVTSHSPLVVSNVKAFEQDRFILMRKGSAIEVYDNTYGLRVDEILTEFFHLSSLRNLEVQAHIDQVWDCLTKGDYESPTFMDALSWLKGHLSRADIEFVRINLEMMKQKKARK